MTRSNAIDAVTASFNGDLALQQAVSSYSQGDWARAEALCRQVIAAQPAHFDALHLLGSILLQSSRFSDAFDRLSQAEALQPANPTIKNKLGLVCTHLKRESEALAFFDRALDIDPRFAEAWVGRAALHESRGDFAAATAGYRRAIELHPQFAMAHLLLGHCLVKSGQAQAGIESYNRVLELVPGLPDAWHSKGNAQRELGLVDQAVFSYEQALRTDANHLASLGSLGDLLVSVGRHDAALPILDRLLRLQPDNVDALHLRGQMRFQLNQLNEAQQDFQRALALNPSKHAARIGVAAIQIRGRNFETAVAILRQAIEMGASNDIAAHLGLSQALRALGQIDEAAECLETARALAPNDPMVWYNQGDLEINRRRLEEAVACFRHACELKPDFADLHTNLLFIQNFLPLVPPEQRLADARLWNERHAMPLQALAFSHSKPKASKRRLRLGYVSSDFREHAVAKFMAPVLTNHDSKQFEVFGYHCSPFRDDVTHALAKKFKQFRNADRLSHEQLAQQIHADGIDILVDLAGHTDGNRLLTFARRPAPVQITYLGYPGTTGMSAMDYRISDVHVDPTDSVLPYTETLLRLPQSLWCYQPAPNMPRVTPLPALQRGHLTFGSFNSFMKVDRRSLELWAKLLRALPGARLVMATLPYGRVRDDLLAEFVELGVESERIELLPKLDTQEFYERLGQVDVSLDPVSVNGATTTCESLWLGVPVLSRVGGRFLERAGLSILTSAGMPEFACESDEACVALAQSLASDLPQLAAIRAGLRAKLLKSALLDAAGFTRALEGLFREAWKRWEA